MSALREKELVAVLDRLAAREAELRRFLGAPDSGPEKPLDLIRRHRGGDETDAVEWARRDFLGDDASPRRRRYA